MPYFFMDCLGAAGPLPPVRRDCMLDLQDVVRYVHCPSITVGGVSDHISNTLYLAIGCVSVRHQKAHRC